MIAVPCRALAALAGFLLLLALAVAGLAVAVFSLGGGDGGWSLPGLARLIGLPALSDTVAGFLRDLEGGGPFMPIAALCGLGAIVLAVALLVGALVAPRERLLVLSRDANGTLGARRRALGRAVEALAEQPRDVLGAKAKLRPHRRRTGGRLRLRIDRAKTVEGDSAVVAVRQRLSGLADSASLRLRIRERVPRRGGTVR